MDFVEIAIVGVDSEAADSVAELFNRYGHGGAVIESYAPDFDRFTVRTVTPVEDQYRLREIEVMLTLIGKALPAGLPEPRLQVVGESDWTESWKEHFHVVRVGRQFVIKPSWRQYRPLFGDVVIEIDPGLAFGSGLHPTTRLSLEILEDMPVEGRSVFDVGTGSGILALAVVKLGAQTVRAVDVDDVAVRVARENFVRNGYDIARAFRSGWGRGPLRVEAGSAADAGGRQWDIVTANILAHILMDLMPDLAAALAPGGRLILSGMIAEQEDGLVAAARRHRLQVVERRIEEDWIALVVEHQD